MRLLCRVFLPLAALALPLAAPALETSAAVKVIPLVKSSTSWDGKPVLYPAGTAEVTGLLVEIAPGAETGWHEHPVPSFAYVLSGTLEVRLRSGTVKRLQAGDTLVEVVDTVHNGRAVGDQAVKLIVFYAGAVGKPLTVKRDD